MSLLLSICYVVITQCSANNKCDPNHNDFSTHPLTGVNVHLSVQKTTGNGKIEKEE